MTDILHVSTTRHSDWGGSKRYVRIVIHETTKELQKAAVDYNGQGEDASSYKAVGCFHPSVRREKYVKSIDNWVDATDKHYAGLIRFSAEHIDYQVIVHECVHAAAHIYRLDVRKIVNLGKICWQAEEDFAYIVGDLSQQVLNSMYEWETKNA